MIDTRVRRVESDMAVHPGEMLAEQLEVREMTQRQLVASMGRPVQAINEILKGKKAITADTAVQLEAALDVPAYLWLNLQSPFELALARAAYRHRPASASARRRA